MADTTVLTDAGVDIISNTVGKRIADSLDVIAVAQEAMAKENLKTISWSELDHYANKGLISGALDYGDQINDVWNDTKGSEAVEYANPWDYVHSEDVTLSDGEVLTNRPFFQTHYVQLEAMMFSNRAFYACPDGLAAGTYTIKFAQAWSKLTKLIWSFAISNDVPAGGRLAGFFSQADSSAETATVYVYDKDGKTILETVTAAVASAETGTVLGTLNYSSRNGNLNSMNETFYGENRWATSAMRQYLNSTAGKGKWWTPQDEWDIAPDNADTVPGWLSGVSEDFLNSIKTVKVVTYKNTVTYDGSADITYDRVFLPSLEQIYAVKQVDGEGSAFEYWKRRIGTDSPQKWYTDYATTKRIQYSISNHTSAQYVRLRSAGRGGAYYTWVAYSSGFVNYAYARYSYYRPAPIVVI